MLGRKAAFVTVFIDINGVIPPVLCTIVNCDEAGLCSAFASIIGRCFPFGLNSRWKRSGNCDGDHACYQAYCRHHRHHGLDHDRVLHRIPAIASLAAAAISALPQLEPTPFAVHCYTLAVAVVIWLPSLL